MIFVLGATIVTVGVLLVYSLVEIVFRGKSIKSSKFRLVFISFLIFFWASLPLFDFHWIILNQ